MSVLIKLDNKTALTSDTYQWSLAKKGIDSKTGEVRWSAFLHYTTLADACVGYTQLALRKSTCTSFQELQALEQRLVDQVRAIVGEGSE